MRCKSAINSYSLSSKPGKKRLAPAIHCSLVIIELCIADTFCHSIHEDKQRSTTLFVCYSYTLGTIIASRAKNQSFSLVVNVNILHGHMHAVRQIVSSLDSRLNKLHQYSL